MTKSNEFQIEHYAMYRALIDHENQCVELELRRYAQPVLDLQLVKVRDWALRAIRNKYPSYSVEHGATIIEETNQYSKTHREEMSNDQTN